MKRLFLFALAVCLFAPLGMAQSNEGMIAQPHFGKVHNDLTNRALGDALWALDLQTPTGDIRLLGTEFDGTNYWATGALDFSIANLYEFDSTGLLLNTYNQPIGNWGYWGWRDLAWDGQYLHAGDDSNLPGYITIIDPADGSVAGQYGPFPVVPCRALAYDPVEDCFWTASFSSSLYKCFKDGTSSSYTNPGYAMYGAAAETAAATKIWWWSQDGNGLLANEMLPDGTFTGDTFDGDTTFYGGGIAGGAGAYDAGGGQWELVGLAQGSPDHIVGYDLATVVLPLEITPDEVSAWYGGTFNFYLSGGPAGRGYIILGSASGTSPGFNLPGGLLMELNWDWFTDLLLGITLAGGYGIAVDFLGTLDGNGMATAQLNFPGHCQLYDDVELCFAWCTYNPFDFVSNSVCVLLTGAPPPPTEYSYDDGSTENLLGYYAGGEMCWANYFDFDPMIPTITEIGTIWGSAYYPGYGPGNGVTGYVAIWEDPTADNNPADAYLNLGPIAVVTANYDQDITTYYSVGTYNLVENGFFVGCWLNSAAGQYIYPMDQSGDNGRSWLFGNSGGVFDFNNLTNNSDAIPMVNIGFPCFATVRAK